MNVSDRAALPSSPRRIALLPGSEAALVELRDKIGRLEAELDEIERRSAALEAGPSGPSVVAPRSARMAGDLASASIERERAQMRRFLEGTEAVCEARLAEARSAARVVLSAARDDLGRAVQERAALVEEVIASPPPPSTADARAEPAADPATDTVVDEVTAGPARPAEATPAIRRVELPEEPSSPASAPTSGPVPAVEALPLPAPGVPPTTDRRREVVVSLLMWVVGGALVVVGVAFALAVVLMLLG